jgi:hypothetical protein
MAAVKQRSWYAAVIIILVIIYSLFNDSVRSSYYIAWNDEMAVSNLERMQKEVVMACSNVLSQPSACRD